MNKGLHNMKVVMKEFAVLTFWRVAFTFGMTVYLYCIQEFLYDSFQTTVIVSLFKHVICFEKLSSLLELRNNWNMFHISNPFQSVSHSRRENRPLRNLLETSCPFRTRLQSKYCIPQAIFCLRHWFKLLFLWYCYLETDRHCAIKRVFAFLACNCFSQGGSFNPQIINLAI